MIRLEHIAIKDDSFRLVNKPVFDRELQGLPKGKYRLTVEKYHKKKSNPQLGYLFSCVYPLVFKALNDAGWEFTTIEEVDEYCKSMFSSKEVMNRHTGEVLDIPGLKRNMTTLEMMTYVDAIRDWCAEFMGVYIPDPETQLNMKYEE